MKVTIPLDKMTTAEKLVVMEHIWDDLSRNAKKISSPIWHGKVLQQREENLNKGIDKLDDWENAKRKIRKSVL